MITFVKIHYFYAKDFSKIDPKKNIIIKIQVHNLKIDVVIQETN
jgi:hypothetical protein